MARHYNPSISERIQRTFGFKAGETLDNNITGPVAVIPIQPVVRLVKPSRATSTGSATIFTAASDKDTYLTGVLFSYTKDATCDMSSASDPGVTATIDGVATNIIRLGTLTLTAQSEAVYISFPIPLKIDRGTAVQLTSVSYTAGTMTRSVVAYGYTEEVTQT